MIESRDGHTAPLPIAKGAEAAVLALNNAHAVELSWLDPERLACSLRQAFRARCIGDVDAFLIAFNERASCDSPNYRWFQLRYPRFVYVDRVAVAPTARGRGYARALYADLFDHAADSGYDLVACEVNSDPPNAASEAFHSALGFAEVGRARIHGGSKAVRYLTRRIC